MTDATRTRTTRRKAPPAPDLAEMSLDPREAARAAHLHYVDDSKPGYTRRLGPDGPLDQRVMRHARAGVAPLTVADTIFSGSLSEGRSAATCDKDALQNLTTALIDSGQIQRAADALTDVAARCATFK